jgi:hypothetical protein
MSRQAFVVNSGSGWERTVCLEADEGQEVNNGRWADRMSHITDEHPPDDGKGMLVQD